MSPLRNEYLVLAAIAVLATSVFLLVTSQDSFAHQSGCHTWHSCPSDTENYECGDKGYCSQCPDNQYCKAGQPKSSNQYKESELEKSPENNIRVPDWIKNNAKWWSEGKIGDDDFVLGIKHLVEQNIMKIPTTESNSSNSQQIPSWIKNNAKWWADGQISDDDFVKGIQYMISNGIMKISTIKNTSLCQGTKLCITGTVEKIVDGDTIYVKGEKIRLSLTNTPEKNDVGYSEATQFTSTLCPVGSTVTVDQDDKQPYDAFGRLVGKVFCGSKMLNEELLISNHAQILTQYCLKSEYANELWAKKYGC